MQSLFILNLPFESIRVCSPVLYFFCQHALLTSISKNTFDIRESIRDSGEDGDSYLD